MTEKNGTGSGPTANEGQDRRQALGALPVWKRRRFRTAVLCIGVFAIGAALGSFATSAMMHCHIRRMIGDPEAAAEHHLSRMRSKLNLSDQQADEIRPSVVTFMRNIVEAFTREHDALATEIEKHLTDEQIAEHKRLMAKKHRCFSPAGDDSE